MDHAPVMTANRPLPIVPSFTSSPAASAAPKLKLQPPQKHVDKSQKQQFIVEFPPEALPAIGNVTSVSVDRKHFLPPVLLTGIAKQQKEEKGRSTSNSSVQGEMSLQILSRDDKEITFEKCERCQEKDSHIFPLFERIDVAEEREKAHPRNCFALIGSERIQFEKGKAVVPVYFRCCPTHHTSKKGENFVRVKVRIVGAKGYNFVYESEFVKVQWKKGKHNRQPKVMPGTTTTTTTSTTSGNASLSSLLNTSSTAPSMSNGMNQSHSLSGSPTQLAALPPLSPQQSSSSPQNSFPSMLFNDSDATASTSLNMLSLGMPPYQAYMNMFQHLQNYYVRPLEDENKKLRQELSETNKSVGNLKEENRKLRDLSLSTRQPARDDMYLNQLRTYQYELECAPSFLSGPDDESSSEEDWSIENPEKLPPNSRRAHTIREAMKLLKFRSSIKLVLLKHNGTHWYEPIDRAHSSSYRNGDRIGIRIINKNPHSVLVRLHRINYANQCNFVPLCNEDFLKLEGCREDNDQWETAYFDLGPAVLPNDYSQPEAVELLKLLITTSGPERISTSVTRSFVIHR